jgi:RNA polymerase sigma-70 factor (ECF subfamily)
MHEQPDEEITDEQIVEEVQKGKAELFRLIMERYEAKMSRYAKRFLFAGDEAQDLLQEIFIKAYVNIKSFDTSRRFSPWIYRIAHNEFVNAVKKKQKERENVSFFDFDVLFPHPVAKETADGEMDRREIKAMLDKSLDKLGAKYKDPLVLYYYEEMDYRAIADILRIPVSTVGVRLQRGKAMLKKIVNQ